MEADFANKAGSATRPQLQKPPSDSEAARCEVIACGSWWYNSELSGLFIGAMSQTDKTTGACCQVPLHACEPAAELNCKADGAKARTGLQRVN